MNGTTNGMFPLPRTAHLIGIGGIGVSAVAKLLKHAGAQVSGSDGRASEVTKDLESRGIRVHIGHDAAHLRADADMVVYSGAVPEDNPELSAARRMGIPCHTYFEFLGAYSRNKRTITVSGTNGKSTTTAMLGMMLIEAGLDPTVIVGSKVPAFADGNLRIGGSDLFVVEACEHEANMLNFTPDLAVVTNVEEDHLDFYRDRAHIVATFQKFIEGIKKGGSLVLNADDHGSFFELKPVSRFVTFGIDAEADYRAESVEIGEGQQTIGVVRRVPSVETLGSFVLRVPGRFNASNALAALAAAMELGASADACRAALFRYVGIWRRFERIGEKDGAVVISDYGHHPTAIRGTLVAAKEFYPDWRVILCFQPHHRNRTRSLFDEFVASMDGADEVILSEIFDVAGRDDDKDADVTSRSLADAIRTRDGERGVTRPVLYAPDIVAAKAEVEGTMRAGDVVLVMGAGDIYTIAAPLVGRSGEEPEQAP
jgi:UDP-N-acetylmuramate--alanine ligase